MNIPSAEDVRIDPDAVRLARWQEARDPEMPFPKSVAPGMVCVGQWGWALGRSEERDGCAEAFAQLATATAAVSSALYVYPASASHITIATLSSFKNVEGVRVGLDPEQDARVVGAWSRRLGSILQESQVEPFVIRASKLELSPGAAIVHFEDPTGTIERIRDRVRTALAGDPSLEALDLEFGGKVAASIHVPNIIHSSYARFVATVSPEEFSAMEAAFNALSARFKPFDILVDRITLANESSPYMHQRRDEHGEFSTWALPCGSEGTGGNKGTSSGQEEDPDKKQPRDGDQEVSASLK